MTKDYGSVAWPGWNTVRMIGRGSFGAVYEIERDVFGHTEKAALKVISIPQNSSDIDELYNDGYDDESITQRFQSYLKDIVREYALMSEMKGHTNIVYCDDLRYIQHDDGLGWDIFIKMELLTPLPRIFDKKFSERQVLKIALDLCDALIICKKNNVVHRDIKPQNVFFSKDGSYKLGDFGIAKTAERTTSGTKTGTYKYMAPEVYNNQPYGHSADIYSLGMVLYWLLNERRTPFLPLPPVVPTSSDEDYARESRFSGMSIPAPKHGSSGLKRIVLKACAFDPDDRYATAAEMKKEIINLISGAVRGHQASQTISPSPVTVDHFEDGSKTEGVFSRKRNRDEEYSDRTVSAFHAQDSELTEDDESQGDRKRYILIAVAAFVALLGVSLFGIIFIIHSVIKPLKYYKEPVVAISAESEMTEPTEVPVGTEVIPETTELHSVEDSISETTIPTEAPTEAPSESEEMRTVYLRTASITTEAAGSTYQVGDQYNEYNDDGTLYKRTNDLREGVRYFIYDDGSLINKVDALDDNTSPQARIDLIQEVKALLNNPSEAYVEYEIRTIDNNRHLIRSTYLDYNLYVKQDTYFTYDMHGRRISEDSWIYWSAEPSEYHQTYQYDATGNISKSETYNIPSDSTTIIEYTYDSFNRRIELKRTSFTGKNEGAATDKKITYTKYIYNAEGLLVKQEEYNASNQPTGYYFEYSYDRYGNCIYDKTIGNGYNHSTEYSYIELQVSESQLEYLCTIYNYSQFLKGCGQLNIVDDTTKSIS